MNILFLTIARITNLSERGIYTDLMRKFRDEGHKVYIVCPAERRYHEKTSESIIDGVHLLNVWTLNAQKTSLLEKGVCTLLLDGQFTRAVKSYYSDIRFDLVLYSTPPITFGNTISYVKQKDRAVTYLLLKDIFPQNAVDLGMIGKKGGIYTYFRRKEKKMYAISDHIGCLSPANVRFLLEHNKEIPAAKVEVNSNSIEPVTIERTKARREAVCKKYNIPVNATIFIYGGNLGKPQGVHFLKEVLISNNNKEKYFFIIVGSGTEFQQLNRWYSQFKPSNTLLMQGLPKTEYDELIKGCDVGLIFLDKRFTIPNFPSRLLSYLENEMAVLAATDPNTDIGTIISEAGCGLWSESGDLDLFNKHLELLVSKPSVIESMGKKGKQLLMENYTVDITYQKVMKRLAFPATND